MMMRSSFQATGARRPAGSLSEPFRPLEFTLDFCVFLGGLLLLLFPGSASAQTPTNFLFSQWIQPVPFHSVLSDPGYFVWCGSPIADGGQYHLFYSRWPTNATFSGWVTNSEICHAVAATPDGPFTSTGVVLGKRPGETAPYTNYWDSQTQHNPHIRKFGSKFYLYYMASVDPGTNVWPGQNLSTRVQRNQRIGVIVANSIQDFIDTNYVRPGAPIVSPVYSTNYLTDRTTNPTDYAANRIVNNETVIQRPDGKYQLIYKSNWPQSPSYGHGYALADNPDGPYTLMTGPMFSNQAREDENHWYDPASGKYYLVIKNFTGPATEQLQSYDSTNWTSQGIQFGTALRWEDGTDEVFNALERPALLTDTNGTPIMLYMAAQRPLGGGAVASFNVHIPLRPGTNCAWVMTGAADVKTNGTLLSAVNFGATTNFTVNGLTFAPSGTNPSTLAATYGLAQSGVSGGTLGAGTINTAYNGIPEFEGFLDSMVWQTGTATAGAKLQFNLTGLPVGHLCRLQLFFGETRSGYRHGPQTVDIAGQWPPGFDYGPASALVAAGATAVKFETTWVATRTNETVVLSQRVSSGNGLQVSAYALHDMSQPAALNFSPPLNCSADTDVLSPAATGGTNLFAYTWGTAATVNGVAFAATNATSGTLGGFLVLSNFTLANVSAFTANSAPFSLLSAAYSNILRGAVFNSTGGTTSGVILTNLTVGHSYLVQLWASDPRAAFATRLETVSSGGGSPVTLNYNSTLAAGGVGQAVFATFTAGSTAQPILLQTTSTNVPQLNAIQLQDVSAHVPVNLVWQGSDAINPNNWDMNLTTNFANGAPAPFQMLDNVTFDDTATSFTPAVVSNVIPGSVTFNNSSANAYSLGGSGSILGAGGLTKAGNGLLTISATNQFGGSVALNGGTVSVATLANSNSPSPLGAGSSLSFSGGTLAFTGSSGGMNRGLTFNAGGGTLQTDTAFTLSGMLSGSGSLTKTGLGTVTFTGNCSNTAPTSVLGGKLVINSGYFAAPVSVGNTASLGGTGILAGAVTVQPGGTFAPGAASGTLTINNDLTLAGNLFIQVDKSSPQTNAAAWVTGALTNAGLGTVTLTNLNPNPAYGYAAGETFVLFNKALANGAALSIAPATPGPGLAWTNRLAVDGSIGVLATGPAVTSVAPNPVTGSSFPLTLTLNGSGFVPGCLVLLTNTDTFAATSVAANFLSSSQVTASATLGTMPHNWNATVVNPGPGSSSPAAFTVAAPATRPLISSVTTSGLTNLILGGSGGTPGYPFAVVGTTNVAQPWLLWAPLVTNFFDGTGSFSLTNAISPAQPQFFYGIQQ
jgi:autotransporter-associated beta strand protein